MGVMSHFFTQMFLSVKRFAEHMTQLHSVSLTESQGHGIQQGGGGGI